jgi:hypothetical protein
MVNPGITRPARSFRNNVQIVQTLNQYKTPLTAECILDCKAHGAPKSGRRFPALLRGQLVFENPGN